MNAAGRVALGSASALTFVGLWELADRAGWVELESTARPSEIGAAASDMIADRDVFDVVGHTVEAFAISWAAAVAVGVAIGVALGLSPAVHRLLGPTVVFLRFVPPPALVPVVLLIWGFTMTSEVVVAVTAAVWPVVINTTAGVRQVDSRLYDVGRSLRLGRLRTITGMVVPSAMPMILTGARIASSVCLIMIVTVEILGVPEGIGHEIHRLSQAFRPAEAFVYVVIAGMLGVVINTAFRSAERRMIAWQPEAT